MPGPDKTTLKIFIASSAEVKEERDLCVLILNKLGKVHDHLHLEPVLWEYDMPHSNYPKHKGIQNAINETELKDCALVVFIFYGKIGKYTREEFEYCNANNKVVFGYFKTGFSPNKHNIIAYTELLDFKESLNETLLYESYKDLTEFEKQLYTNLNLYLTKYYPKAPDTELLQRLNDTEQQIKALSEKSAIETQELQELRYTKEALTQQLNQSQQIIQQQAKDKEDLQNQLAPQKEHHELKAKASEAIAKNNYADAENYLKESAKDSIAETASTFYELGKLKKIQLQYATAADYFELAAKIEPQNSFFLVEAGQIASTLGYYNKALDYHEKSLAIRIQTNGEDDPNVATSYNELGSVYDSKGEYDKAIEYYEKASAILKNSYGEEHDQLGSVYNNLGLAYDSKGEHDKAIEYYERALAIDKKVYNEDHPKIATRYNNLGEAFRSKGEYDKAIEYYENALIIYKKCYGEEHSFIATAYNNLGSAYDNKGEYDKAIEYHEKALAIDKKFYGEEHPDIARDYNNVGFAYDNKGDYADAIKYYNQCLPILYKFFPPNHPHILITHENLAAAQAALQDTT